MGIHVGHEATEEGFRRTRGEAAAAELDAYPVDRFMVNVGTLLGSPSSPPCQGGDGQARRRLMPVNADAPWPDPNEAESPVLGIQTKLHRWATDSPNRRFDDLFNLGLRARLPVWLPGSGFAATEGHDWPASTEWHLAPSSSVRSASCAAAGRPQRPQVEPFPCGNG